MRGTNIDFGPVTSRASNKKLLKTVSRGRPCGSGNRSRAQGHPRRRGMSLVGRPRIHGRYTQVELRNSLKDIDESGTESVNSANDSSVKSPLNYPKSRERRHNYLSRNDYDYGIAHRWTGAPNGLDGHDDEPDKGTEAEFGSDQRTVSSVDHLSVNTKSRSIVSPKYTSIDDIDQRMVSSKENLSSHSSGNDGLSRLEKENRKLSRSRNQVSKFFIARVGLKGLNFL